MQSYWLCAVGGLLLGLLTGLFGKSAIAATTVAVERVVLRHLQDQLAVLGQDLEAKRAVLAILAEEQEHHDRAASESQAGTFWPTVLSPVVAASNRVRHMAWHAPVTVVPNPSVKASPNSYTRKARNGHIIHRPFRALRTPL